MIIYKFSSRNLISVNNTYNMTDYSCIYLFLSLDNLGKIVSENLYLGMLRRYFEIRQHRPSCSINKQVWKHSLCVVIINLTFNLEYSF